MKDDRVGKNKIIEFIKRKNYSFIFKRAKKEVVRGISIGMDKLCYKYNNLNISCFIYNAQFA